jgi:hypothetical protein
MRRFAAVALALAIFAPAASAAAPGCAPAGAKILRSSALARVYSVGTTLYGCTGAYTTKLGALKGTVLTPATRITRYLLAGRYVAFDTVQMGVDTFSSTVTLIDLENGVRADSPATPPLPRPESFKTVTEMALSADGIVAWIGRTSAIGLPKPYYYVRAITASSSFGVNVPGSTPTDLRLVGHQLSWRQSPGGPRTTKTIATGPVHSRRS